MLNYGKLILSSVYVIIVFVLLFIPIIIVSFPVVAILLCTSWNGYTTIFGNEKWGKGNTHFSMPTKTYWEEFNWLVLRNPVNNLHNWLGFIPKTYTHTGNSHIGDKIAGGYYIIKSGWRFEFYSITPYTFNGVKRCLRVRIGWKIAGHLSISAPFVFTINPIKAYSGI